MIRKQFLREFKIRIAPLIGLGFLQCRRRSQLLQLSTEAAAQLHPVDYMLLHSFPDLPLFLPDLVFVHFVHPQGS